MSAAEQNQPDQVASSTAVPSGTYAVDVQESEVRFRAKAFGLIWVRGTMPIAEGRSGSPTDGSPGSARSPPMR